MRGFTYGLLAFAVSLSIYAFVVRKWRPSASTRLLGPILFIGSFVVILALCVLDRSPGVIGEALLALALSSSLIAAYVVANTAIETDSPTQSLILFLDKHRSTGVTNDMIDSFIDGHPFRNSRLDGLINDGLVERCDNRLACRSGGRLLLDLIDLYRHVIRRSDITG